MTGKPTKKQSFLHGAAVLALATAIVKLIGAVYKIPMQSVIGQAGFGYFNTAYAIYDVLLMISTAGLPVAMSRMISEAQALNNHNQIRKIFSTALKVFLTIGIVGSLGMLLGAKRLASDVMSSPNSWASIAALAPAVLFICIISALRGFFQGQSNMTPTSVSQVFEAICKLVVGLGLAWLIMQNLGDATYGAGGAILGVTFGCVVSVVYLFVCYRRASCQLPVGGEAKSTKKTLWQLLAIAVPITLGSAGLQIINLADIAVYMRQLVGPAGVDPLRADELKGIYDFCRTIFNLPCSFITPLVISIIPSITEHITLNNTRGVRMVEGSVLRITGLIAMPCAFGLLSLARPIVDLLTSDAQYTALDLNIGGVIMALMGITVIFNSLILVTNAIMQAHKRTIRPVINMLIGGIIKVIVNYFLVAIPELHIMGAAIGTLVCYFVIMLLNIITMLHIKVIDARSFLGLGKPLLAGFIMGGAAYMANGFLSAYIAPTLATLVSIALAAVIYLILVVAFKVITHDDCMLLPKGEKIAKILRIH